MTAEYAALLLSSAMTAAGARVLAEISQPNADLVLRRVVFTIEDLQADESTEAIRAVAYPLADPVSAQLDLAVQGRCAVGAAVDIFGRADRSLATATFEYALEARADDA